MIPGVEELSSEHRPWGGPLFGGQLLDMGDLVVCRGTDPFTPDLVGIFLGRVIGGRSHLGVLVMAVGGGLLVLSEKAWAIDVLTPIRRCEG